ncbi:molybdopterin oxidoreductase family protein [Haloglycomyces albus]|uniref:molybdopterin oxidoreductase family protein n=1 Tax=Haloglycomyces albus TaxID=526067 RepID=UPI00046CD0B2|nr:molybdopterin oxidoreductase family protein [Haloglycomyces albus]
MTPPVNTHCPYCALQCSMTLHDTATRTPRIEPDEGGLCQKGWTAAEPLDHPDRLTTPLIHGEPADWDDALQFIVDRYHRTVARRGTTSVGVFGSGGLTNEKAYQLGKFARLALQTPYIDYNGRFCMSSAAAAFNRSLGIDRGLPFPKEDLAQSDVVILVGANPAETMPPFMRHLDQPQLIVVDPRHTATAAQADLHLATRPGSDLALANGLLQMAIAGGHVDRPYVDAHTRGFEEVERSVTQFWPARTERLTGVDVRSLYRCIDLIAGRRCTILTARGAEQHTRGVDTVTAWINLALALGLVGRPSSGVACLTGQGNGQGGREHGQKADQLPGYRSISNLDHRRHTASVWGVEESALPGLGVPATELFDRCGAEISMLLVVGSNPAVSAPASMRVQDRLRSLETLVVSDFFLSETAQLADVVLPAAQWAEEDGTTTNLEGRVIRRRAYRRPPGECRSDLWITSQLAKRLHAPGRFSADPGVVFDELRAASSRGTADYSGLDWEELDGIESFWPFPHNADPTPRLFSQLRFPTDSGKAQFIPVDVSGGGEQLRHDDEVWMTTGRVLTQYQSGTQTSRVSSLEGRPFISLHPDTAQRLGFVEGQEVHVESGQGTCQAPLRLDWKIRRDTAFVPFHFSGDRSANRAVRTAVDPISGMPEFKVNAVSVRAALNTNVIKDPDS